MKLRKRLVFGLYSGEKVYNFSNLCKVVVVVIKIILDIDSNSTIFPTLVRSLRFKLVLAALTGAIILGLKL